MNLHETFALSIGGLTSHKLRTLLTMLGIIFGVAAVIAMLSIGEGAKQEALQQIRQMGIHNVIVQHWDREEEDDQSQNSGTNLSSGLSLADAEAIKEICPLAHIVSPQREVKTKAQVGGTLFQTMVVGTVPSPATAFAVAKLAALVILLLSQTAKAEPFMWRLVTLERVV